MSISKKIIILLMILSLMIISLILSFQFTFFLSPQDEKMNSEEKGIVTNIWLSKENLDNLKEHDMKYLYVDVGNTNEQGRITTPQDEIVSFISTINEFELKNDYDFILIPYSEIIVSANLDNRFQANFIDDYIFLNNLGFDGILVDIEKIPPEEQDDYLLLLDKLNTAISSKPIIVYSGHLNENPNEWEWSPDFYKKVSKRVDYISIGAYDTYLSTDEEYLNYMNEQITSLNNIHLGNIFFLGLPTHKPEPETISNALEVYKSNPYSKKVFVGTIIFAEWTIDGDEWETYDKIIPLAV